MSGQGKDIQVTRGRGIDSDFRLFLGVAKDKALAGEGLALAAFARNLQKYFAENPHQVVYLEMPEYEGEEYWLNLDTAKLILASDLFATDKDKLVDEATRQERFRSTSMEDFAALIQALITING